MLEDLATTTIFHMILMSSRIGAALMTLTGFGETYIPTRVRLLLSFMLAFLLLPVLEPTLPPVPQGLPQTFLLVASEIVIGLLIGGIARILQGILHIAGMIIAFQSSLASALLFDANQGSQGSVFGNFFTITGLTLIFVTDLHHLLLEAIAHSYVVFPAATMPPLHDFANLATATLSDGFRVAFMLSAPMIIVGTLLYLGAGLLGRLMPNMQVFFVLIPVQIYVSFFILVLTFSAAMMWYVRHYAEVMDVFLEF